PRRSCGAAGRRVRLDRGRGSRLAGARHRHALALSSIPDFTYPLPQEIYMYRTPRCLFFALLVACGCAVSASAQTTSNTDQATPTGLARGAHPLGSYGGDIDTVSLFNGNVSLNIPIASLPGRGGMHAGVMLSYNSKIWRV